MIACARTCSTCPGLRAAYYLGRSSRRSYRRATTPAASRPCWKPRDPNLSKALRPQRILSSTSRLICHTVNREKRLRCDFARVPVAGADNRDIVNSVDGDAPVIRDRYSTTFQKTTLRRDRRKPIFSSHVIGMPPNRSEIRRGEAPLEKPPRVLARIFSSSGNSLL